MLHVRWLGRVPFEEAHALQRALRDQASDDYLLMLEHPHVVTLGLRGDMAHVLVDPANRGARGRGREDRQGWRRHVSRARAARRVPGHVGGDGQPCDPVLRAQGGAGRHRRCSPISGSTGDGLGRLDAFPGVWVDPDGASPRKICAVGIRISRGRSMHGFALNVDPDMEWFSRIVPCGISDMRVTSLAAEGIDCSMSEVVEAVARSGGRSMGS